MTERVVLFAVRLFLLREPGTFEGLVDWRYRMRLIFDNVGERLLK